MSEGINQLKGIGTQRISAETHIPAEHISAILNDDFTKFTKVQFLGFVSILEREYEINLDELKLSGISYFGDNNAVHGENGIFDGSTTQDKKPLYIGAFISIFVIAIFLYNILGSSTSSENTNMQESVKALEVADPLEIEEQIVVPKEENVTQELNISVSETNSTVNVSEIKEVTPEVVVPPQSFKIVAKSKVWFGYIDIETNKKYQKVFKGSKSLDPLKGWLLLFGHGYIDMYIDGKLQKFKSRGKVRFLYKDGELRAITAKEFRRFNRGRKW